MKHFEINYELNNNMDNHIEKYFSFAVWNEVWIQVRDKANFVVVNQVEFNLRLECNEGKFYRPCRRDADE